MRQAVVFSSLITVTILTIYGGFANAHVQNFRFSASTLAVPTIDGVVGLGEWGSADAKAVTLSNGFNAIIRVMNDGSTLYIAVSVGDPTANPSDFVALVFDNNHNGVGPEVGDDALRVELGGLAQDGFYTGTQFSLDTSAGGTNDIVGAASSSGGMNHFELAHPLDSADKAHDFSLKCSDTVGFLLVYWDAATQTTATWPAAQPNQQGSFADITVKCAGFGLPSLLIAGSLGAAVAVLGLVGWQVAGKRRRFGFYVANGRPYCATHNTPLVSDPSTGRLYDPAYRHRV